MSEEAGNRRSGALERLRASRKSSDADKPDKAVVGADSADERSDSQTPSGQKPLSALQKRRQQQSSQNLLRSDSRMDSSRVSARSPFRMASSRSRGRSIDSSGDAGGGGGSSDEEDTYLLNEKEKDNLRKTAQEGVYEEEEDLVELVGTSFPAHVYPLHLLPLSRLV